MENNFNNVLIKFSTKSPNFNSLKNDLKERGGSWTPRAQGWKFPVISSQTLIDYISEMYEDMEFRDFRK